MPKISTEKRNKEISIRVNESEWVELKKRTQGKPTAAWLRDLGLGVKPVRAGDPELIRTLGRIGSNLNQITRHVNIDKELDKNVLEQVKGIRDSITALLDDHLRGEP